MNRQRTPAVSPAFVLAWLALACVGLSLAGCGGMPMSGASMPDSKGFSASSTAFPDGGMLQQKNAADDASRGCGGQNVSPPLQWSNAPAKTRSFAILMYDPDGRGGLGVSHWVAYGIAPTVSGFAEGTLGVPTSEYVGGKGLRGNGAYLGPCPPPGDMPHHYMFTVMALDLAPDALPAGLTRDEFLRRAEGHALVAMTVIGRYGR